MNCQPGDVARIVGQHPALGINDRIITLADEPPFLLYGEIHWRLKQPLRVTPRLTGTIYRTGEVIEAGTPCVARALPDSTLRPIRDPGPDAVDEMVKRLGVAPKIFALEDPRV